MNSPERIGAFFDLDGTLLQSPSLEWRFITWLAARDKIGSGEIGRWLGCFAKTFVTDPRAATVYNKSYLSGLSESLVDDWEKSIEPTSFSFFEAGIKRVAWHVAQSHRVFLISGTLACIARVIARKLPGIVETCATELSVGNDGRWTGALSGEHMTGATKARAVRDFAARFDLALWDSYAYGNSIADVPMLNSVGHRVAVNPGMRLQRVAHNEGWQSCKWKEIAATALARAPQLTPRTAR
jgi:HAD superfamily hydrolase (TIGR01490 family)